MATDRANYTPEELDKVKATLAALPYRNVLAGDAAKAVLDAVLPGHDRRLLLALANEIELNDYWEIEQAVGHIRFRAAAPVEQPPPRPRTCHCEVTEHAPDCPSWGLEQPPTQDEIIETDRWGL